MAALNNSVGDDINYEKLRHECGIFALYGANDSVNAANLCFFALYALQHRGQESAGIASCERNQIHVHKGMGLVNQVFNEEAMKTLKGRLSIGHTRYSTAGGSRLSNAQPFVLETDLGPLAVAHNGQLTTQKKLRKLVLSRGTGLFTNSDSEIITQMLATPSLAYSPGISVEFNGEKKSPAQCPPTCGPGDGCSRAPSPPPSPGWKDKVASNAAVDVPTGPSLGTEESTSSNRSSPSVSSANAPSSTSGSLSEGAGVAIHGAIRHEGDDSVSVVKDKWERRIAEFMAEAEGAYALALMTPTAIYGCRDRYGLRPLCLGSYNHPDGTTSYALASESCAFGPIGFQFVREIQPGEIVRLDSTGARWFLANPAIQRSVNPALCIFEYVYFARPDSILEGQLVHSARQSLGAQLARESPPPTGTDIIAGVPDSSTAAAIGFSLVSGVPFMEVLCKNRYIGRTFIQPDQQMRENSIRLKFNPLASNLKGKSIVLVDDSIVRGNTMRQLIKLLRTAGAEKIHIRISSPVLKHPCYMGVDIGTYDEILATHLKTVTEMCTYIGADSLAFLSHEGMVKAVREGIDNKGGKIGHCSACFTGTYPLEKDEEW